MVGFGNIIRFPFKCYKYGGGKLRNRFDAKLNVCGISIGVLYCVLIKLEETCSCTLVFQVRSWFHTRSWLCFSECRCFSWKRHSVSSHLAVCSAAGDSHHSLKVSLDQFKVKRLFSAVSYQPEYDFVIWAWKIIYRNNYHFYNRVYNHCLILLRTLLTVTLFCDVYDNARCRLVDDASLRSHCRLLQCQGRLLNLLHRCLVFISARSSVEWMQERLGFWE